MSWNSDERGTNVAAIGRVCERCTYEHLVLQGGYGVPEATSAGAWRLDTLLNDTGIAVEAMDASRALAVERCADRDVVTDTAHG